MTAIDMTALDKLVGLSWPCIELPATDGTVVALGEKPRCVVLFAYPRTSPADGLSILGWDAIPGAKGCTAQSCGFRDEYGTLMGLGVDKVYGLSTQDTEYQAEAAARLHLPFPLLSDDTLKLRDALNLPVFEAGGMTLLHRFAMVLRDGTIERVFHSLEDTGAYAATVIDYLRVA